MAASSLVAAAVLLAVLAGAPLATAKPADGTSVHMTYHWHMQQPIYWPAPSEADPNTYQKAAESISLTSSQGGHPQQNLDSIFGKADRVADYQHYPVDAINSCSNAPDMGASVSFSGCLIENLNSLAAENRDGYSNGWNNDYANARRTLKTSGGFPKLDLVAFTYHHALMPLVDKSALAKELAIHKIIYNQTWGAGGPAYSKGFFPAEMAFTERAIPTLVEAGIEWVIVPNNHLSRACEGYAFSPAGDNNDPPNKADQVNPAQSHWFSQSISRGCTPNNAIPFAYTPHRAFHVDPDTGKNTSIIVVPSAMAMSWQDGYACYDTSGMDQLAAYNDPEHPILVLLAHDGDNDFGGGYSYYTQCVSGLVNEALSKGYTPTTVQQYLNNFPVPEDDFVHVEDGAWVNADSDFGAPQCINWNWPLVPKNPTHAGDFDIPTGWAPRERNWAVITAALNYVQTAEQMNGGVDLNQIQAPGPQATEAEIAWHFFLPSITSGYMYYGNAQDMPEKPTVACNAAVAHAQKAIATASGTDQTPPSIWAPQRLPWNPGAYGAGALWGYKYTPMNTSFWVWTFVHDVSGVQSVNLHYRIDEDGVNPLDDFANEVFEPEAHGMSGVGAWQTISMTQRAFPIGNVFNITIDFTCDATGKPCLPTVIADEYYTYVTGLSNVLLDYYIDATDTKGNVAKSDIYHVWVGSNPA